MSAARGSAARTALVSLRTLSDAGVIAPIAPHRLLGVVKTVRVWGTGVSGGFQALVSKCPDRIAVIDERGELTYRDLDRRSNALAHALKERGVGPDDSVALMCRNHRGFVDALLGVSKTGASLLFLNTAFAGPQLADVLAREKPTVLIHDEEFTGLLWDSEVKHRFLAWTDEAPLEGESDETERVHTLDELIETHSELPHQPPARHSRLVILTSGTTGTPKGAPRKEAGLENGVALLSRLPLKAGWRTHIAAPLFHTWGLAHLLISALLGTTMVLRRHFDPEASLRLLEEHDCDAMIVIPVMLQRMLNLPQDTLDSVRLANLKAVASSGSALPGDLAIAWMDQFGDNLYNTYGSTEVAYATIATPADLRRDARTAGRAPAFTTVKVLDADGHEVPVGETGRIFVGNGMLFDGYTGGGNKEIVDGLMATGDVGRFDADGLLFVEGRDDEMIVSGGENVFPQEVEHCLTNHPEVIEAAALGVIDAEFGQRLVAFVVTEPSVVGDEEACARLDGELREWVRGNLARFKVPREIIFVPELPRNATGKVLKRDLEGSL